MDTNSNFEFYMRIAKPFVLNLKETRERALAAAWLREISEREHEPDKLACIKRFLFALQKRGLSPPFKHHPDKNSDHLSVKNQFETNPATKYNFDFSGDLCQYVAYQEIENFGSHCYLALSPQPLPYWHQPFKPIDFNRFKFGIGGFQNLNQLFEEEPSTPVQIPDPELDQKKKEFTRNLKEHVKRTERFKVELAPLLGMISDEPDDRIPPSWGSNLIRVQELRF